MEITKTSTLPVWNNLDEVRKQFAANLSETEFQFFIGLGKSLNANPFTREIWAVKFGTNAASIFLGRDFYRKKAQEQPSYDGHYVEAVYSNDDFSVEDGNVKHKFSLKDRGSLVAAYCVVKKKGISQNYFSLVQFSEYNLGQSNWKTKPETMIKKVAESQGLRGAFQGVFEGTYDESENTKTETGEEATVMISEVQKDVINSFLKQDIFTEKEKKPILSKLESFDFKAAEKCIDWLKSEAEKRNVESETLEL